MENRETLDSHKQRFERDLVARIMFHLANLESQGTPGSVAVTIHCDSKGARKVIFNAEEVWSSMTPPKGVGR